MGDYAIGVDLGGTNLRAAAVSRDGKIFKKLGGATPVSAGRDAVIADIVRSIQALREGLAGHALAGVGVGIPGYILMAKGIVTGAPNMPDFVNYPVRDEIENGLGAKVILENDANAAALGEKWMGAGRDVNDLVLLTLGTGIGGGIISDGKVLRGYLGMAAELGHITVAPNGYPCGCGNTGCVEKYASATAVSAMAKLLNLGHDLTAEQVYKLALGGNERAKAIFEAVGVALGTALADLINIFNAPLYLLGGGLAGAWDCFQASMVREVSRRSFTYRQFPPRIERAALGPDAGLYGTAYLALQAS
ncbi:MAG TPA: ROK family protein [Bryobacteraceae bacterium]|nr:ROK family protein [Bryobacteraceae bacterium]